jgi:hypothetical protein
MAQHRSRGAGYRSAHTLLLAAAVVASPAWGVDRSWNSASGSWSDAARWFPVGVPLPTDHAFIGNVVGVQNDAVTLNMSDSVAALTISDGMTLRTDRSALTVTGDTLVSGSNTVPIFGGGSIVYRSRLLVELFKGTAFSTNDLTLASGATMVMTHSAFVNVDGLFNIAAGTTLSGEGVIDFNDSGTTFINSGEVRPGDNLGLTLRQFGGGSLDLDGSSGDGELDLDFYADASMRVQAPLLTDAFSGVLRMGPGSSLDMQVASGWTSDIASEIHVVGDDNVTPAVIEGSPMTFAGEIFISGEDAQLQVYPSELTLHDNARVNVGTGTLVRLGAPDGELTIDGGTYTLEQNTLLMFNGDTIVHAGEFSTSSDEPSGGYIDFAGETRWDGSISVNGIARQMDHARVIGSSTINAVTFDMDGYGPVVWDVDAGLVINAVRIDSAGSTMDGTIDIGPGLTSHLTINLDDPTEAWVAGGTLRVAGAPGFYISRVAGSALEVAGVMDVASGLSSVNSAFTLRDSASLTFGAGTAGLRLNSVSRVRSGAVFQGAGTLQSGAAGDMTLDPGVNTSGVRLENLGTLRIGDGPGAASVDRFRTTGRWVVELGGPAAGAQYDRLVVAGGQAEVGGILEIRHVDLDGDGSSFLPTVGQTFTILTAVGGVSGAFPAGVESSADGWTFHWSVVHAPNEVRLRLDSADPPPCIADFNADGVVNSQDFFDFLGRFFVLDPRADVNLDGVVNSQDFFDFLTRFFGGCK